jgi:hypothetical protein
MLIICPDCWRELTTPTTVCPKCGAHIVVDSPEYEPRLVSTLARADAEMRAHICWALGSRRQRSSVRVLVKLLRDPDVVVRIAALRGLGEIGDKSAINAVDKLTMSKETVVQSVAKKVLKMLMPATHPTGPVVRSQEKD